MRRAPLLLLLALTPACASSGAVPAPFPTVGSPTAPPIVATAEPTDAEVNERPPVVGTALSLQGAPYRDGGADPSGFDCSGFVSYVFAQQGIYVPRTVSEQYAQGQPISKDAVAPGDLVFFSGLGHMGIYIGGGQFIHAPRTGDVVKISNLSDAWYAAGYVGARRL